MTPKIPEKRPRHQDKDVEAFIRIVEQHNWRVVKGSAYFKAYCPCDDQHIKTIHLTPSGRIT